MQTKIVRIGNSQGVCLSRALLDEAGLTVASRVEIRAKKEGLYICSAHTPREGWEEKIQAATKKAPEEPELEDWRAMSNAWDHKDWTW